jgi:TetR/AcrR family transcriptional regulator, transcriptional repressor for nem operon
VFREGKDYLPTGSYGETLMSDVKTGIMDAAERRIQLGGFGGFSFREIAADVGIKSSSVHYYFPTKENLAAAVIRRWAEETSKFIDEELKNDPDPVRVWTNAFRGTALSEGRMCPCTVLGAASQDLPPEVSREVKGFFKMCLDKLIAEGLSPSNAAEVLSTITGALVIANALGETAAYDHATSDLLRQREALPSARRSARGTGKAADLHTAHAGRRAPRPLAASKPSR